MDWKDCIKKLNGHKVITHRGNKGDIVRFEINCKQLGHFIGKYQVRFVHGGAVGWFTYNQLTICNNGYSYANN